MRKPDLSFFSVCLRLVHLLVVGLLLAACKPPATPTTIPPTGASPTPLRQTSTPTARIDGGETSTPREPSATPTPVEPTDDFARVLAQSQVRRLTPVVLAGAQAPLSEIINDTIVDLQPGGMVSTDQSGEAEVIIEDCLKIYLYQGSQLTRNTCRESDAESGLAVCTTAGMISVANNCLSQVVIVQTPNSEIVTTGTEFTVMYVEDQELTVVQVLEGEIEFTPVLAAINVPLTPVPIAVSANNMIFTTSEREPVLINRLPERQVLPLNRWDDLRSDLTVKTAYVDLWMESSRQIAVTNTTRFPELLVRPTGVVNLQMLGTAWNDPAMQTLVTETIPWLEFIHNLWPKAFVTPELTFPDREVKDARFLQRPRREIGVFAPSRDVPYPILILVNRDDKNAIAFAEGLNEYLLSYGAQSRIQLAGKASLDIARGNAPKNTDATIFITVSGDYFE